MEVFIYLFQSIIVWISYTFSSPHSVVGILLFIPEKGFILSLQQELYIRGLCKRLRHISYFLRAGLSWWWLLTGITEINLSTLLLINLCSFLVEKAY